MLTILVGKRASGAEEVRWEDIGAEQLTAMAATAGLFGDKKSFVLRGALAGERAEEFLSATEALSASAHKFYFEEEKLLKKETEELVKIGAKIETAKAEKKPYTFDHFGLTAALAAKDRKKLWLGLMQAFGAGEKPEAVAGLLAWKARQMKNIALSRELVCLYHDSHRGAGGLELLLERFALKL